MKKICLMLSILVSMFAFSINYNNGNYKVSSTKNNIIYEMDIIVRNNNIISATFDIKDFNGRSLVFGNKDKMNEKLSIESMLRNGENIEDIRIFDETTTTNIKKLYYYLIEKINVGEQGRFVL